MLLAFVAAAATLFTLSLGSLTQRVAFSIERR
jgi:hypothetical protein